MSNILTEATNRLPSYLNTTNGSNISNLLATLFTEQDNLSAEYRNILSAYNIDTSEKNGLDKIGANLNFPREDRTDEDYRTQLKFRIAQNTASGTIPNITEILRGQLNISDPRLINIEDVGTASVSVEVPLQSVIDTFGGPGVTDNEAIEIYKQLVRSIVAAGIDVTFQAIGTFRFDSDAGDIGLVGSVNGFADDDLTQGGTFGGEI